MSNGSNQETEMNKTPLGSICSPVPPNEQDCCNEGCPDCVWLEYIKEVKDYYKNDKEKLKEAHKLIPSPHVREFVKLELKGLIENS